MEWIYALSVKIIAGMGVLTGVLLGGRKAWKEVVKPTLIVLREKEDRNVRIDASLTLIAANQEGMKQLINTHGKQIEYIQKELKPNGGGSIFDKITTMNGNINFMIIRGDAMIKLSHSAIYECDGKGNCINVNAKYSNLTGLTLDEAYGVGWLNAIADDDRERVMQQWKQAVENSREFHSIYNIKDKSGNKIKVSGSATISRDKHTNSINHIMGIIEPV